MTYPTNKKVKPSPLPTKRESENGQCRHSKLAERSFMLAIATLTVLIFFNSLGNDFISTWDDHIYVIANDQLKDLSLQGIKSIFTSFHAANYHPITTLSWAIEYAHFGLDPTYYHTTNLLLHLLNTALVFRLILLITKRLETATIVALFFAIHPLHVETVAFISQRKDLLYAVFYLGALISYVHYIQDRSRYRLLLIAFLLFVMSALSKSMAVTLPVLLLLMDYFWDRKLTLNTILEKVPFFVFSVVFGIIAIVSQKTYSAITDLPSFSFFERIFLVSYSFVFYIVKLLVPFHLSAMHYYPNKTNGLLPVEFYLAPVVILVLLWLVFRSKRFRNELIWGLLFFLITISLVLQIIPVGSAIVAERYTYIPYIGLFFIIGQLFSRAMDNTNPLATKLKPFLLALVAAYAIFFSIITWDRTKVWADSFSLWSDVIEKNPSVTVAFYNRGVAKYNLGDYQEAIDDYDKAVELNPYYAEAYNNRGESKEKLMDYQGAVKDFDKAIGADSDFVDAYLNRARLKAQLKDYRGALTDFDQIIQKKPGCVDAYLDRATIRSRLREYEEAIEDLNTVIKLNPTRAKAYNNRGIARAILKDYRGALEDFNKAIELKPDYDDAHQNRDRTRSYLAN
jgi:tetratricopeptide (TPR) repeat protein